MEHADRSDIGAQVETLRDLAVTYQSMNDTQDRIAVLREAVSLQAPKTAYDDKQIGAAYSYYSTLRMLGEAHVDDQDYDSAAEVYKGIASKIDGSQNARLKSNLRDLYADAILGQARVHEGFGEYDAGRRLLAQAENGQIKSGVFDRMYSFWAWPGSRKRPAIAPNR